MTQLRARERNTKGQFRKGIVLPLADRFWLKVEKRGEADCWNWQATRNPNGYGIIIDDAHGRMLKAHRVSWALHFGAIPHGKHVLHRCDNPACVNPAHLFLGSHRDNMADMARKGRAKGGPPLGTRNNRKITQVQAEEIRRAPGLQREIAERFGITQSQVSQIKSGKSWPMQQQEMTP